jgi:hypothetical protein
MAKSKRTRQRKPARRERPSGTAERLTRRLFEDLMFGSGRVRRFTQYQRHQQGEVVDDSHDRSKQNPERFGHD